MQRPQRFICLLLSFTALSSGLVHAKDIEALMAKMTLDEKVGQLVQGRGFDGGFPNPGQLSTKELVHKAIRDGDVGTLLGVGEVETVNELQKIAVEESRLGIPLAIANDVIHGWRTIFPIPLAETASWNLELIEKTARIGAIESSASGTHWNFAPMVDIARDPRWGRIAEGSGEDPLLGSLIAAARVRGFQGDDLAAPDTVLACAKHYIAYGAAQAGRDYHTVDISRRTLRDIYLPPFQAAIDAGVGSIMTAFNEINGVPATGNIFVMRDILRGELGFTGLTVSDFNSVAEMIEHGVAADKRAAAILAIRAGLDVDMTSFSYLAHLKELVESGEVPLTLVDEAVRRVLTMKQKVGVFERPYTDPELRKTLHLSPEHRAVAREMARQSIILLKNDAGVLPLSKSIKKLAVIGPLAESQLDVLGCWRGRGLPEEAISTLTGLKNVLTGQPIQITFASGGSTEASSKDDIRAAVETAQAADAAILVIGEPERLSGEAASRSKIDLPGDQLALAQAVLKTGTPTVVVIITGRPLTLSELAEDADTIVLAWQLGSEHGHAVADVLFGDAAPSGRLPVTFPRNVGQIPIFYNYKNTGRPMTEHRYTTKYLDVPNTPLFPFGYGLTYTKFEYGQPIVTPQEASPNESVTVKLTLKNTGQRDGAEVVQVYAHDPIASVTRPVRQLVAFKRVELTAGQQREVSLEIPLSRMMYTGIDMQPTLEPGPIHLYVGPHAERGKPVTIHVTK